MPSPDDGRVPDGGTRERYLVKTEFGDVVVAVNHRAESGLAPDLLALEPPDDVNTSDLAFEVPLRAFAAKMIDLVERFGVGDLTAGERMRTLMVQEKATSELKRIERWARARADGNGAG